jgi:hypothetical protein
MPSVMMSTRHFICMLMCVAFMTGAALGDPPKRAKSFYDFGHEYGFGMNMSVPLRALTIRKVEQWADILGVSEAQRLFMLAEFERFVEKNNAFVDREAPGYIDIGKEMWVIRQQREHKTWEFYELGRKLDRESARLRRELTALELGLINAIEFMLTPEQRARVPIITNESRRRNCRVSMLTTIRWADVELRDIWHGSGAELYAPIAPAPRATPAAELATPAESRLVDVILTEYEARLTSHICRMADLQLEARGKLAANRTARNLREISSAEGRAEYQRIRENLLQVFQQVRLINEQAVERIASALSNEASSVFIHAAKMAAFPELYPDDAALHELFAALTNDDALDERQQKLAIALQHGYLSQYSRKCHELEAFCIEWAEQNTRGINGYQIQFLPRELKPMLDERIELSRRYVEDTLAHLGPGILVRHAHTIPAPFRSLLEERTAADQTINDAER